MATRRAVAKAVVTLKEARNAGVDTLIDVTPFDVERDIRFGEEMSRKSGMQIVGCTGQHFFVSQREIHTTTVDNPKRFFSRS